MGAYCGGLQHSLLQLLSVSHDWSVKVIVKLAVDQLNIFITFFVSEAAGELMQFLQITFTCYRLLCNGCVYQDGRVMMLEPVGEEDEADLLHQDDEGDQSGALLICFYHCNLC